mmetsp:Transcript_18778/g.58655  ORF Transcript_18778/g.58655 Transcript_18778/m.58655 type:complete len:402 (+) Transcript_18778:459-1664(+)
MAGKHGPAPLSPTAKLVARIALLSIAAAVVVAAAGEAAGGDIHTHYRGARLRPESGGFELAAAAPPMAMMAEMAEDAAMNDDDAGPKVSMMRAKRGGPPPAPAPYAARGAIASMRSGGGRNMVKMGTIGGDVLQEAQAPAFDPSTVARMLVRTGSMRLRTLADVSAVADAATKRVEAAGGYAERRDDGMGWLDDKGKRHDQRVSVTLRIPVDAYAGVIEAFKQSVGGLTKSTDVEAASDAVRDVTGEYVDAAARAATLEATRDQLTKLMERADVVKDVLSVQRELSSVTQQLEARKATMQRLSKSASLSTLQLTIQQKEVEKPPTPFTPKGWSPGRTLKRALARLRKRVQGLVNFLIFLVVFSAPVALIGWCVAKCLGARFRARLGDVFDVSAKVGGGENA